MPVNPEVSRGTPQVVSMHVGSESSDQGSFGNAQGREGKPVPGGRASAKLLVVVVFVFVSFRARFSLEPRNRALKLTRCACATSQT